MKFLCIGYFNPELMNARPPLEIDAIMRECRPHLEQFHRSGQMLLDAGLGQETKNLRREAGKVRVTDGPCADAKEIIGSVSLIEAEDMEDAIRVAKLHPTTRIDEGEQFGWRIELRPVHSFEKGDM